VPRNPTSGSTAERQVILYCAGTAARRAADIERVDSLIALIDWSDLATTLQRRRLLATLGPRIVELAGDRVSGEFRLRTEEAIVVGRRHGGFLQLITLRALAMLADAGIRAAPLKGPLLGEAIYGDPGRRSSSDIDLLIDPAQLHAAVEVVRELGYVAPRDFVYDDGLPLLHFVLTHERGELPSIELHWRVHWYERSFAHKCLLPPVADSSTTWRPAAADELASLLLFYARDGFVGLRLASDLSAWWDTRGGELAGEGLQPTIGAYPAFGRVIPAAANVAEKIVGLPATRVIGDRTKLRRRERMAARLANPHPQSSLAQVYADIGLIDGLLMPGDGLGAFVRRHMILPSEVLDQQAQRGGRRRARSPLTRSAGMVARYGLTVTRLMRAPETLR
jgi:hypothetical protein